MTPDELATLDDDRFFEYLSALDQQPDASVEDKRLRCGLSWKSVGRVSTPGCVRDALPPA